jgi:hypothetical protein
MKKRKRRPPLLSVGQINSSCKPKKVARKPQEMIKKANDRLLKRAEILENEARILRLAVRGIVPHRWIVTVSRGTFFLKHCNAKKGVLSGRNAFSRISADLKKEFERVRLATEMEIPPHARKKIKKHA